MCTKFFISNIPDYTTIPYSTTRADFKIPTKFRILVLCYTYTDKTDSVLYSSTKFSTRVELGETKPHDQMCVYTNTRLLDMYTNFSVHSCRSTRVLNLATTAVYTHENKRHKTSLQLNAHTSQTNDHPVLHVRMYMYTVLNLACTLYPYILSDVRENDDCIKRWLNTLPTHAGNGPQW